MTMKLPEGLYINGEWIKGEADAIPVINPADETLIGNAPAASAQQTDAAIAAAREAFDQGVWPRMSIKERVAVLEKFLAQLMLKRNEIIDLIILEAGDSRTMAEFLQFGMPMKHAAQLLEDALSIKNELTPLEITPAMDGSKTVGTSAVIYEPIGVVTAITAYNFPFFLNIVKFFHAAVMGNTVILKPSPLTPYEALIFGEVADAVGLPKGVLNIVNGDLACSEMLTVDKRVDMITFTGSDKVGASIIAQSAPTLKKTHMELGGKSPLIVRADADIQQAAMMGVGSITTHTGQGCALTTRHLVHNSVRDQYVQTLTAMLSHTVIGNPVDPNVTVGPLIRANARERIERYVAAGLDGGADLVYGGKRPPNLDKGFYYEPTIFNNVDNQSIIAQEEIFGPVAVVMGFDSDEEAIQLANDSDFGLFGAIYSKDAGTAYEMALKIRSGGLAINGGAGTMLSSAPFGGYKRSGFGREYGRHGLLDFCEIKSISFHAG